jgi:hypothetical protein
VCPSDVTVPRFNDAAEPARTVGFQKREPARPVGFRERAARQGRAGQGAGQGHPRARAGKNGVLENGVRENGRPDRAGRGRGQVSGQVGAGGRGPGREGQGAGQGGQGRGQIKSKR